ncbi:MAG TPA: TM1802 family CRISPR-associated protein [Nitrososphaerales archaeon]|nr:TM1802 family CRISPR-associated protein [Nitrososphaerales archaeon]
MLTAIASLSNPNSSKLSSLVQDSGSEDCLSIIFKKSKPSDFLRCELSSNNGEELYLYHKEPSGKPGLFLSWTIPAQGQKSVRQFQSLIKKENRSRREEDEINQFWEDKFAWFARFETGQLVSRNKLLNDSELLSKLDQHSKDLLLRIVDSYARSFSLIKRQVTQILLDYKFAKGRGVKSNKLLVTIAFEDESGKIEYPADIKSFVDLFQCAVSGETQDDFICSVCNLPLAGELSRLSPLEFLTQDQLVYLPDGSMAKKKYAIALCQKCSDALREGQTFINHHLSYRIMGSKLFFWLIPILPDTKRAIPYLNGIEGEATPLYLGQLRKLCQRLDTAAADEISYDPVEGSELDSWISYTSVFCYKDKNGHTRIVGISEGIYPEKLRFLGQCSNKIQRRFPYPLLEPKVMFSFPLLSDFFEGNKSDSLLVSVMEALFIGNQIEKDCVAARIIEVVRSQGLTRSRDKGLKPSSILMKFFVRKVFDALITMEYLAEARIIQIEEESIIRLIESPNDKYVDALKKFIVSHRFVNQSDTIRSTFLVGVAVGLLLEIQMKRFNSYPYWKHLNRLELNLERVKRFYPDVKSRIANYRDGAAADRVKQFEVLVAYIGANLEFRDELSEHANSDAISLAFSIGLSLGYLIFNGDGVEN